MSVNVKSVFHSVGACVPLMIEQGRGGAIINVASVGTTRPRLGLVWYNASKAAVANVSQFLFTYGVPACGRLCNMGANEGGDIGNQRLSRRVWPASDQGEQSVSIAERDGSV
jgi:short chain dehydrogenase